MSQVELTHQLMTGPVGSGCLDPAAEIVRLEAEIVAVQQQLALVRGRIESRQADRAAIQAELAASRTALEAMERDHDAAAAGIRRAAQAEIERIRAAARPAGTTSGDVSRQG